jgi:hypothetical protein
MPDQIGQEPFDFLLAWHGSGIARKGGHVTGQAIPIGLFSRQRLVLSAGDRLKPSYG